MFNSHLQKETPSVQNILNTPFKCVCASPSEKDTPAHSNRFSEYSNENVHKMLKAPVKKFLTEGLIIKEDNSH